MRVKQALKCFRLFQCLCFSFILECATGLNHNSALSIRYEYDTIEEFNVYRKAECVQLNLAHVARRKLKHKRRD